MDKRKEALSAVIKTLDSISVQGRENMTKIMLCIDVIQKVINNEVESLFGTDVEDIVDDQDT